MTKDISLRINCKSRKVYIDIQGDTLAQIKVELESNIMYYIKEATKTLNGIIERYDHAYRIGNNISDEMVQRSLKEIVDLNLFDSLFVGANPDPSTRNAAKELRELSSDEQLKIKINSGKLVFPWALLYTGKRETNRRIETSDFWGFKHVLADIPDGHSISLNRIFNQDGCLFSFNYNNSLDQSCIQKQDTYFNSLSTKITNFSKMIRTSEIDLSTDFQSSEVDDKVLYLFCHAIPHDNRDINKAALILTDDRARLTLKDLKNISPVSNKNLRKAPLVFFNACDSLLMSPTFYNGFARYFIDKGAAGVLGTFAKVPVIFASDFALFLLRDFLENKFSVGEAMLRSRQEFLAGNNILGLCYLNYCSPDIQFIKS